VHPGASESYQQVKSGLWSNTSQPKLGAKSLVYLHFKNRVAYSVNYQSSKPINVSLVT